MVRRGLAIPLLLALACVAPAGAATHRVRIDDRPIAAPEREVRDLIERIDRRRAALGCPRLERDERLTEVATEHSRDMIRRHFFDHVNPDGRDPFQRMTAAGIQWRAAAENIAQGQGAGREVYEDWMHSPGHRRNIEGREYDRYGLGLVGRTWTLDLARDRR
jgi:uncharacterized protein YkwD